MALDVLGQWYPVVNNTTANVSLVSHSIGPCVCVCCPLSLLLFRSQHHVRLGCLHRHSHRRQVRHDRSSHLRSEQTSTHIHTNKQAALQSESCEHRHRAVVRLLTPLTLRPSIYVCMCVCLYMCRSGRPARSVGRFFGFVHQARGGHLTVQGNQEPVRLRPAIRIRYEEKKKKRKQ